MTLDIGKNKIQRRGAKGTETAEKEEKIKDKILTRRHGEHREAEKKRK
ncbi:MAG: hypothetical protein SCARUB_04727 [Candidatus Scalindua rubra]|uniref:Uncharacterized protein n=1 Tax=Candidatus Scalindua rubra TaxID=1872076 RepID=A0A1E3X3G4_9BACT|nr:MAG: hypothetical protein SCARUB_04727 [Candidatus Scalindua rubra]